MKKIDIIILVIASRGQYYDKMINNYWSKMIRYCKINNYNLKFFLIFGNNVNTDDLELVDDDKMILNVPDSYMPGILNKTIEAFKMINRTYDYKHIIRTNLSSFFIINNLINISKKLGNTNIYAGVNGIHKDIPFISGAGIWLSKDIIEHIINNSSLLDRTLIDDVSIGKLLTNYPKGNMDRYDLTDGIEIYDKTELIHNIVRNNYYHIRVNSNNKNLDINYMTTFVDILYNS